MKNLFPNRKARDLNKAQVAEMEWNANISNEYADPDTYRIAENTSFA